MKYAYNVYTCTDHDAIEPTGVASIIVARNKGHARLLLNKVLAARGLKTHDTEPYELVKVDLNNSGAIILQDGDY